MPLDPQIFDEATIKAFREQYELTDGQPALSEILNELGNNCSKKPFGHFDQAVFLCIKVIDYY